MNVYQIVNIDDISHEHGLSFLIQTREDVTHFNIPSKIAYGNMGWLIGHRTSLIFQGIH